VLVSLDDAEDGGIVWIYLGIRDCYTIRDYYGVREILVIPGFLGIRNLGGEMDRSYLG
jgi:hypothetical protein